MRHTRLFRNFLLLLLFCTGVAKAAETDRTKYCLVFKGPHMVPGNVDGSSFRMRVPSSLSFPSVKMNASTNQPVRPIEIIWSKFYEERATLRGRIFIHEDGGFAIWDRWLDGGTTVLLNPDLMGVTSEGTVFIIQEKETNIRPTPWLIGRGGWWHVKAALGASANEIVFGQSITLSPGYFAGPGLVSIPPENVYFSLTHPELATVSTTGILTLKTVPRFPQLIGVFAQIGGNFGYAQVRAFDPDNNDSDHDGMPNDWELLYGLNPTSAADASIDTDGDGLSNLQEYIAGTNPLVSDTDQDGLLDGVDPEPLTPEAIAPTIAFITPTGGSVDAGSRISVTVSAVDNVMVKRVTLHANGLPLPLNSQTGGIFSAVYDVPSSLNSIEFVAKARDIAGNTASAEKLVTITQQQADTTITGRAVRTSGNPIFGAVATISGESPVTTGSDGLFSFVFRRGQRQSVTLTIRAASTQPLGYMASIPLGSGGTIDLGDIILTPKCFIQGRVLGLDQEPLPGAFVTASGGIGAVTGAEGSYMIAYDLGGQQAVDLAALDGVGAFVLTGATAVDLTATTADVTAPDIQLATPVFENDLGTRHNPPLHRGIVHVLPFPFSFFGANQTEIHANSDGIVTFAPLAVLPEPYQYFMPYAYQLLDGPPGFAPLYSYGNATTSFFQDNYGVVNTWPNPDPHVGLYVQDRLNRTTVTWFRIHHSIDDSGELNTFQASLSSDGRIRFSYTAPFGGWIYFGSEGIVGLTPGGPDNSLTGAQVNFSQTPVAALPANRAVYEEFPNIVPAFDLGGRSLEFAPGSTPSSYVMRQEPHQLIGKTMLVGRLMNGSQPRANVNVAISDGILAKTDANGAFVMVVPPAWSLPLSSPKATSVSADGGVNIPNVGIFPGVINVVPTPDVGAQPPPTVGKNARSRGEIPELLRPIVQLGRPGSSSSR